VRDSMPGNPDGPLIPFLWPAASLLEEAATTSSHRVDCSLGFTHPRTHPALAVRPVTVRAQQYQTVDAHSGRTTGTGGTKVVGHYYWLLQWCSGGGGWSCAAVRVLALACGPRLSYGHTCLVVGQVGRSVFAGSTFLSSQLQTVVRG
jgi:hypothetical protein